MSYTAQISLGQIARWRRLWRDSGRLAYVADWRNEPIEGHPLACGDSGNSRSQIGAHGLSVSPPIEMSDFLVTATQLAHSGTCAWPGMTSRSFTGALSVWRWLLRTAHAAASSRHALCSSLTGLRATELEMYKHILQRELSGEHIPKYEAGRLVLIHWFRAVCLSGMASMVGTVCRNSAKERSWRS
jgi:hypothetical protein